MNNVPSYANAIHPPLIATDTSTSAGRQSEHRAQCVVNHLHQNNSSIALPSGRSGMGRP